jgi:hypothetical protein
VIHSRSFKFFIQLENFPPNLGYIRIDIVGIFTDRPGHSENTKLLQQEGRNVKCNCGQPKAGGSPIMHLLHAHPLPDCFSHHVTFPFPCSLPSSAPRATAQLCLELLEAVSGAKLCFLHDPATPIPPGSSPPTGSTTPYFLDRVQLSRVGLALTAGWDS